jgi:tetratricopeptide (TPR) repeat protein
MGTPLLVEYYDELPDPEGDDPKSWEVKLRTALEDFKTKVTGRYNEGTLLRLLDSPDARGRRAAILALGLIGTVKGANAALARMLHDDDRVVRQFAVDALWSLWFRADSEANNQELRRLADLRDRRKKRTGLDALIHRAPNFAEAYNQRALLHYQMQEWHKSISDCERTLDLNPQHFGAAAQIGRCFMELGKHRAALKAFRQALRIHPGLEDVEEAVRALESALGEEGRRDDKK